MAKSIQSESKEIKINNSILNSWIINWFYKSHFNKQLKNIIDDHFDPTKQLLSLLNLSKKDKDLGFDDQKLLLDKLNDLKDKIKKLNRYDLPVVNTTTDKVS